ncbi:RHS repeat-associated core domain-containing protein [Reichenbachiella faecimaris]|uniref:RHS repeat-associated core domain-containing protein n=1 Tax=Reichenbachiella faecimaris TaxID=692418 RepID=A0A1W2GMS9_REIFA|nr:RHS repeat-associated core domain-containing protein [Reichenbachiella faecimaris]SMD37969.1 RHS repeat-associated core domain-containing protein [Reichenbachiella faecimaris]
MNRLNRNIFLLSCLLLFSNVGLSQLVIKPIGPCSFRTYSVSGGGSYCSGGSGKSISLSSSEVGTNYSLRKNGAHAGYGNLSGTGGTLTWNNVTEAGTYTVFGIQIFNGDDICTEEMNGSVTITVKSKPTSYSVTGGGSYCSGSSGVSIGLSDSQSGVTYQLKRGSTNVGSAKSGTGNAISFGNQTTAGTYTVVATKSGCTRTMSGSKSVTVKSLPTLYSVTGGGSYCSGGSGVSIGLSDSQSGVTYQLKRGSTNVGSAVSGTGSAISFGNQTTAGSYTVVATKSGCTRTMSGRKTITIVNTPLIFDLTGGGDVCSGSGVPVGLSGSESGASYQLIRGSTNVGSPVSGNGSPISFGNQSVEGFYTVQVSKSSCTSALPGKITISDISPTVFDVSGGGSYCSGGSGKSISLSSSEVGTNYSLRKNGAHAGYGNLSGTGGTLTWNNVTEAGTYTVFGIQIFNGDDSCTEEMNGSVTVTVKSKPTSYSVTGGGSYCSGSSGVSIGLSDSQSGVTYQLKRGSTNVGSAVSGTGSAISFGNKTTVGTYTVVASKSGCQRTMAGSKTVTVNQLPIVYAMTGGGSYCSGDNGVPIGLEDSESGVTYTLVKNDGSTLGVNVPGTGTSISFGTINEGTYQVVATKASCSITLPDSKTVTIKSLPIVFNLTGGGDICESPGGVPIGIVDSEPGVIYQLKRNGLNEGSTVSGDGHAISFGLYSKLGIYTVEANKSGCPSIWSEKKSVTKFEPNQYELTGGGVFCGDRQAGQEIKLSNSESDVSYQLIRNINELISTKQGTGNELSFGDQITGRYRAVAIRGGCSVNMLEPQDVEDVSPTSFIVSGSGSYCEGDGLSVSLNKTEVGTIYNLKRNGEYAGYASIEGDGTRILWENITVEGTYTVKASKIFNNDDHCTIDMQGEAVIEVDTPERYNVSGGGNFCPHGNGATITLDHSQSSAVKYQLTRDGFNVGSEEPGTGSSISWTGLFTEGTYAVTAIKNDCSLEMNGNPTTAALTALEPPTRASGIASCGEGAVSLIVKDVAEEGIFYEYTWFDAPVGGNVVGTGKNFTTPILAETTSYYVSRSTEYGSGCSSLRTESVAIINPKPLVMPISSDEARCGTGSVVLESNEPPENLTYGWYDTSQTFERFPLGTQKIYTTPALEQSRSYYVAFVNEEGCAGPTTEVEAIVNPIPGQKPTVKLAETAVEQYSLTASGATTEEEYHWYNNDIDQVWLAEGNSISINSTAEDYWVAIYNKSTSCEGSKYLADIASQKRELDFDKLIFKYLYDDQQRMTMKRVPGAEWVYMVYDQRDRLVMTQDGNQRDKATPEWSFTKYDQLNRPVLTGTYPDPESLTREQMQARVNDFYTASASNTDEYFEQATGSIHQYTNQSFPKVSDPDQYLTITYYDNYDFTTSDWELGDYSSEPQAKTYATGGKVRVDLPDGTFGWNESVTLYDSRYRVASTVSRDYLGNQDTFVNEYYSLVHPLVVKTIHTHESQITGETTEITQDFDYDHADRLLSVTQTLDVTSEVSFAPVTKVILENEYNELGELIKKKLNQEDDGSYSQEVDYEYNIRGWLTQINDPGVSDPGDYFSMSLSYETAGQYNGNIGATAWKNPFEETNNQYDYTYDPVNRLKSATYNSGAFSVPNIDYDANGNILALQRKGLDETGITTDWDHLDYDYSGNQLIKVDDAGSSDFGFKDGADATREYEYDANGNMISDANKGIENIEYNHLNLPAKVEMNADGSDRIEYIYDAAGTKLAQIVYEGGTQTKRTDYNGPFIYQNDTLQFIQHEEGRIVYETDVDGNFVEYEYQYHLKDHLGNVRATFKEEGDTDRAEATFEPDAAINESPYFTGYDGMTRITADLFNHTEGGHTVIRLNGSANEREGLGKSLKVKPGDVIDMEVYAKYFLQSESAGWTNVLNTLVSNIAANAGGIVIDGGGIGLDANPFADWSGKSNPSGAPKAYLNYLVFDEYYNLIGDLTGYQQISEAAKENGSEVDHEKLAHTLDITESGYVYIYLSNEEDTPIDVFFDDFTVTQNHTPIVSKDDYYPFGLTFGSYSRAASTPQNFRYNNKELVSDLGLGWYDYQARWYDPALGRWHSVDPAADLMRRHSPYNYAFDNPIMFIDPDGMLPTTGDQDKNEKIPDAGSLDVSLKPKIGVGAKMKAGPVTVKAEANIVKFVGEVSTKDGGTAKGTADVGNIELGADIPKVGEFAASGSAAQGSIEYSGDNGVAMDGKIGAGKLEASNSGAGIEASGSAIPQEGKVTLKGGNSALDASDFEVAFDVTVLGVNVKGNVNAVGSAVQTAKGAQEAAKTRTGQSPPGPAMMIINSLMNLFE